MSLVIMISIIIMILLSTAFITLLERKFLSYIQIRKGPNKVGPFGLFQPFSDALKLFNKKIIMPVLSNHLSLILSPIVSLFLILFNLPWFNFNSLMTIDTHFNTLIILLIMSMTVYPLLMMGWASNSKYSNLGTFRNIAQLISYEIAMMMVIISPLLIYSSMNSYLFPNKNLLMKTFFAVLILCIMWTIIMLSETNRSPFDFAESESELVSGFNTEYSSLLFTMIFLTEYTSIILLSTLSVLIFMPNMMLNFIFISMLSFMILMIRGVLPRYRFDLLMMTNWKIILPLSIPPLLLFSLWSNHTP